jgi:hypothetical protein
VRLAPILLAFFSMVSARAAQPAVMWAKPVGSRVSAIALNSLGEIHAAGSFSGTIMFGSSNVTAILSNTPFVARYSPAGEPIWWRSVTTTNGAAITDIGVAPSNDLVIVAFCSNATAFDSIPILTNASLCVVRYNSNGHPRWLRQIVCLPVAGGPRGTPMSIDSSGNVFLTATFKGVLSLAETNLLSTATSTGSGDGFVIKFNPDGSLGWLRQLKANQLVRPHGVGEDQEGNVYVAGHFLPNLNLPTTNLVSHGSYDVFVLSYDHSGSLRWIVQGQGAGSDGVWSLAVSREAKVVIAGSFTAPIELAFRSLTNATPTDYFLAQFDQTGSLQWLNQIAADGFGREQVATEPSGGIFMAGFFSSPANFGGMVLTNLGVTNWFLAKYGPQGEIRWVQQFGASVEGIGADLAGNVVLAGSGAQIIGSTNFSGEGFLAKFSTTDVMLSIVPDQTNVVLSWPSLAAGFSLEANASVSLPGWNEITNAFSTDGSPNSGFRNVIALPANESAKFFRLRRN